MDKIILPRQKNGFDQIIEVKDANLVSDEYHTFGELYDHRVTLFIALCRSQEIINADWDDFSVEVWKSKRHSDGELCFGTGNQFVLGIGKENGKQITYHIPIARWSECDFAKTLNKAPVFDGHTSEDVLERLSRFNKF